MTREPHEASSLRSNVIGPIARNELIQPVRDANDPKPAGCENLGNRLDLHGMPAEIGVPLGLDDPIPSVRRRLPFKRLEQACERLGPAALEIDILEAGDAEELLKGAYQG